MEGFIAAADAFVQAIRTGGQPLMDVTFSRQVLQSILAAYKAAETGTHVSPNSIN